MPGRPIIRASERVTSPTVPSATATTVAATPRSRRRTTRRAPRVIRIWLPIETREAGPMAVTGSVTRFDREHHPDLTASGPRPLTQANQIQPRPASGRRVDPYQEVPL